MFSKPVKYKSVAISSSNIILALIQQTILVQSTNAWGALPNTLCIETRKEAFGEVDPRVHGEGFFLPNACKNRKLG